MLFRRFPGCVYKTRFVTVSDLIPVPFRDFTANCVLIHRNQAVQLSHLEIDYKEGLIALSSDAVGGERYSANGVNPTCLLRAFLRSFCDSIGVS